MEAALRRIAQLEARVRELEGRLGLNSSNSSKPPSSDPPAAPKPVVKEPTGRRPGGQPGHPGHHRKRLPPERVDRIVAHLPQTCSACRAPLPADARPGDPEPSWHQVAELPAVLAEVTEHQGHARTCPFCGAVTWADIPAEVRARVTGPRFDAALSLLSGFCHDSRRTVAELAESLFGVPVSLGTVAAREAEMSGALAGPHAQAGGAVGNAPVKNADETGWSLRGKLRWLWTAATSAAAYFVIHARRGFDGLTALLGRRPRGIVGSDRYSAYRRIPSRRRQICWAHLKRNFTGCLQRGGPAAELGRAGLEAVRQVFHNRHLFLAGRRTRGGLARYLRPVRRDLRAALVRAAGGADPRAARLAAGVLDVYPSLWTFVRAAGVEPTNNHAERVLRRAVLWRKNSFGCSSEAGCRFVERMLTAVQTLRLQGRNVLDFLQAALAAHRSGLPAPALVGD